MATAKTVVLVGAFGFRNLGDDAVFDAWVQGLRGAVPGVRLVAIGGPDPVLLSRLGVEPVPWADWDALIDAIGAADLVIVTGGTLFHDYWAFNPEALLTREAGGAIYYLSHLYLAKLLDRPCLLAGIGAGPLTEPESRRLVRDALKLPDVVLVRDAASFRLLREIGVARPDLRLTADSVFVSSGVAPEAGGEKRRPGEPPEVVVAVRKWTASGDWEPELAAALDGFVSDHGARAVFLPFQDAHDTAATDDVAAARSVVGAMRNAGRVSIEPLPASGAEAEARLHSADLVVGMRLHALILACRAGVPFVALSYDPKVRGFVSDAGLGDFCADLGEASAGRIRSLMDAAWSARPLIADRERAYVAAATERAALHLLEARALLEGGPRTSIEVEPRLREWVPRAIRRAQALEREAARLFNETGAAAARERLLAEVTTRLQRESELLASATNEATAAKNDALASRSRAEEAQVAATALEAEVEGLRRALRSRDEILTQVQNQLLGITGSRGFRVLSAYWRFANRARRMIPGARRLAHSPTTPRQVALPRPTPSTQVRPSAPVAAPAPAAGHLAPAGSGARVAIAAPAFFDLQGRRPYRGGAERYLIELVRLLRAMGHRPEVYQPSDGDWVRHYGDLEIRGLDVGADVARMNEVFHRRVSRPDLTIYLGFFLAEPQVFAPSIGISHGIWWDVDHFQANSRSAQQQVGRILAAFANLTRVVSVDTSTINWVRATDYGLAARFSYLPNFVDLSKFAPRPGGSGDRFTVLFPRRLCRARGFWLLHDTVPTLLADHPTLDVRFVGQPDTVEEDAAVRRLVAEHPGRVRWDDLAQDEMPAAYAAADVSLIPTLHQEGTSLSCLEAMASDNVVVATHVGGLTDIVIDRLNGLLIPPEAEALRAAVSELATDSALRAKLAERGRETAEAFSLERWRERWRALLVPSLGARSDREIRQAERHEPVVVVENPNYVQWGRMHQRPHYLAGSLAARGVSVYWRDPNPANARPEPDLIRPVGLDDRLYARRPVVIVYYPYHESKLYEYDDPIVVYDVLDDISIFEDFDRRNGAPRGRRARDHHERLLATADVVMASARRLLDQVRAVRPDALYVPNGVDSDIFNLERARSAGEPADLAAVPHPRVAFHGAMAEWVDENLLEAVVTGCPDVSFVFIGPVSNEGISRLLQRPNCTYLGEKPSESIPAYLARVEAGIIPFRLNAVTLGVRPLKALEYLAVRKPVVSVPLPEIDHWPGVVQAQDADAFVAAIRQTLSKPGDLDTPELESFVRANSWQEAVGPLLCRVTRLALRRERSDRTPSA
jgi:polysaccharide pyruvyl transferase CsaB